MELILLQSVENLGDLGDVVNVKPGYGRNFLVPKGKAAVANAANKEKFEAIRAELEEKAAIEKNAAEARSEGLRDKTVDVEAKVADEDQLYGSVGTYEIVEVLGREGFEIERSEVRLPEGPLRTVGEHTVELYFHKEVHFPLTVNVIAESA